MTIIDIDWNRPTNENVRNTFLAVARSLFRFGNPEKIITDPELRKLVLASGAVSSLVVDDPWTLYRLPLPFGCLLIPATEGFTRSDYFTAEGRDCRAEIEKLREAVQTRP